VVRADVVGDTPSSFNNMISNHALYRIFDYDTAGRRVSSLDPDTDDPTNADGSTRGWRYVFNPVGDLVGVRDPRGCGQNFYYDRAGRLIGEDYVQCGEAQASGWSHVDSVGVGAVGLGVLDSPQDVDVRLYYDTWVITGSNTDGRLAASLDRAGGVIPSYNARGQVTVTMRVVAILPEEAGGVPGRLADDRPTIPTTETQS
jgi:YD repeat-containing protein